jgi:hypothetical protein
MPSSEEDSYYSDSEESGSDDCLESKAFGKSYDPKAALLKIYCAICAGKHTEEKCPNTHLSRQKNHNALRERFAERTKFQQVGEPYDRHRDLRNEINRDNRRDRNEYGQERRSSNFNDERRRYENPRNYKSWRKDNQEFKKHVSTRPAEEDRHHKSRDSYDSHSTHSRDYKRQRRNEPNYDTRPHYDVRKDLSLDYYKQKKHSNGSRRY